MVCVLFNGLVVFVLWFGNLGVLSLFGFCFCGLQGW